MRTEPRNRARCGMRLRCCASGWSLGRIGITEVHATFSASFGRVLIATTATALALSSFGRCEAQVQRPADSVLVGIRKDCWVAAQVVRTGHPAAQMTSATERLPSCAQEGPPALASRWRTIPADASDLGAMTRASMRIRDGNLYSQLLQVAEDATRPAQVRVAAMLVLSKYVNPGTGVVLGQLVPPDSVRRIPMAMGSTTHTSYDLGAVPMPRGITPRVLALLERLAADRAGQPREVWFAAGMLAKRVRFDMEHLPTP